MPSSFAVHRWTGLAWEEVRVADLRRGDEVQLVHEDPGRPPLALLVVENADRTQGELARSGEIEFARARTADGKAGWLCDSGHEVWFCQVEGSGG
jgi:hypothetical protein